MFLVPFIVMYNNRIRSILCMAKLSPHSVKGLRIQDGYGQNCFKAANWFALSQVSQRVKHWNHCIQHLSILIVNTQSLIEDINALEAIEFDFACRVCTSQIPRPKPGNESISAHRYRYTIGSPRLASSTFTLDFRWPCSSCSFLTFCTSSPSACNQISYRWQTTNI